MTTATREQVAVALFTLLQTATQFNTASRRFQTWDTIAGVDKPALYMTIHKETHAKGKNITPAVRTLDVDVYIFINTGLDPNLIPETVLNNLIDKIDPETGGVLAPLSGSSQQTLGGLVTNVYIDGDVVRVSGDLDGQGVAIIPIKVVYM
jgi:hypothetical protein